MREFLASMAAAGNPGSGRHEIGLRKVNGWILVYDPAIGGAEVQAVLGVDGVIHARRAPRSQRTRRLLASEWVLRDRDAGDPQGAGAEFSAHLDRILAFDGVGRDRPGDE